MEAERWHLIEKIYHSALDRDPSERAIFLKTACGADEDLRREIESLLASSSDAGTFIESPAMQVAAGLLTKEEIEKETAAESLLPGTSISHYQIVEKIGAGGMGEVYRAHDPRLGRDVALKVLPAALTGDPDRLRRFEQEARAAAALNHPNILAIYDVGTWQYGIPYVVAELLEGETLRARLQNGPLPIRTSIGIASQICMGLAAAHDKGIIHRDLKPDNLWLTKDGGVKILDFGLAKLLPEKLVPPDLEATATETTSTRIMGTLGYMSPEQIRGRSLDQRTDIFSLGAVLYEMLSGRRAFQGPTPADTISAILTRDPDELTSTNEAIPAVVSGIVRRSLEKNPDDRFHSARDVAFALTAASDPAINQVNKSSRTTGFNRKSLLILALVIVALACLWLWAPASVRRVLGRTSSVHAIAVLPLENLSGNSEQDYFADGMTDELITELANIPDVRVISRSSVRQFRASQEPLSEIASKLHVDAVLEGSVLRQGDRVRITAQLVRASNELHIWAHTYEGGVSDIILLQNDVARSVAGAINAKLHPAADRSPQAHPTPVSPAAYDAYLKGLYFSGKLTPDDMQKSYDSFNAAIAADPNFAPSYAGLAEAYSWAAGLEFLPSNQALPKAEAAANRALELDPQIAMAHHALAWVDYALKWDYSSAENEFRRAITLAPNNSTAHLWYGMFLAQRNRPAESLAEMTRAKELDPFSDIVNGLSLTPLMTTREYDKVIAQAIQLLQSNPNDGLAGWFLMSAYEEKGDYANAIAQQEKLALSWGGNAQQVAKDFATLRNDFRDHGPRSYWLYREKSAATDPFGLGMAQAHLAETDAMFTNLGKACEQHSTALLYNIQTEPAFDPYRSDPRFRVLLQKMSLPY